ncbi:hypothetical protein [Bacillus sp. B-jedd]|uniref:hypothetical protein n=1 Tax=Bacillus sp. B-jedd TaxID=1476857 RepID=UPI000B1577C0|nr:hypothetical protein [Bacillus sp. B-jedd]
MTKKVYEIKDIGGLLVDSIIDLQQLQTKIKSVDDENHTLGVAINTVEHRLHAVSDLLETEVKELRVCLHKKGAHTLERQSNGRWFLDSKEIPEEDAIGELVEAVRDLGYWCQVAKDVLPQEQFETVQEAYEYKEKED